MASNVNNYKLRQAVRVSVLFQTPGPTPVDPTDVFLQVREPNGQRTTYHFGVDPIIVQDSTGAYHADLNADQPGTFAYSFYGTGSNQAADEATFNVLNSQFFP